MKKVHPIQTHNSSVINLSSIEGIARPSQPSCRICDVTPQTATHEHPLIHPCNCALPIHKGCILSEFRAIMKARHKIIEDKHQQRYNCPKCSEVIRFTSHKQLKCRPCKEIPEFAKKHCCMCITLLISFLVILSMLVAVIVLVKGQIFNEKVMSEAAVIGLSIGIGVLFFIFLYFFITEVLIKISYKVKLIENNHSPRRKEGKHHSISIVDCG